jgi:predicted DNA-binding transcriptional regulator AlpA
MKTNTKTAQSAAQESGNGKMITVGEIRAKFRLGRTAGYELVRRADFPSRIVVSPRCHRWLEREVDAFAAALRGNPAPVKRVPQRNQPDGSAAAPLRLTGRPRPVRARKAGQ